MNTQRAFWKKRPAPYWFDIRAWSLLIPAMAAALGGIAYSVQGLAVSQGGVLPAAWADSAIAWGAVLLGVGCEGGTISACIEIARKRRDGDTATVRLFGREIAIDGIGLAVSYCATVVARMLALRPAQSVVIIALLVVASVADAYFLFTEAGEYLSIRDRNVARWETARWYYEEQRNLPAALAALRSDEPVALSDDMRAMKEHVAELQDALRQSNIEEERLSGELSKLRAALEHAQSENEQLRNAQLRVAQSSVVLAHAQDARSAASAHADAHPRAQRATQKRNDTQGAIPEHLRATLAYYAAHPGTSYAQAARDMACPSSTVRAHVNALRASGAVRVNGHGVEVLEV